MKIVHCFFTFEMGGAQVLAADLLNSLCGEHDCTLIVVNDVVSEALLARLDKRVNVHLVRRKEGSRNPWPLLRFNLLLRSLRPDVVHCHEPDIGRVMWLKTGRRVYTVHDVHIPTTYYHHFDAVVAISDAVQQELQARYDRPVGKVYNGIDTAAFTRRTQYRLQAGDPVRLVQLSRLMHEKKGQDLLLHALAALRQQQLSPFTLDLIGDGPSRSFLEQLVQQLGLADIVHIKGGKDRDWLFRHLADYHLLVQPSRYEGFGLTILEGFAAGLPVLASNIEGPAEIISRTPRGFLFERDDVPGCVRQLARILEQYREGTLQNLMESTVPVTEQEYSLQACVSGYLQVYQTAPG